MQKRLVMETLSYPHCTDPALRIMRTPYVDIEKSAYREVTRETLGRLLDEHTGPEDVPANTKWAFHDFARQLEKNEKAVRDGREEDVVPIVQYELVLKRRPPDWETNEPIDPEATDILVVGPWMLASITRQRRLAVSEAILQQRLTVIYSKRSGRVDQFVVVDDRLKGWLEERAAWCATEQVGLCRWHEPEDLAAAIENGRIYSRQAPDNIVTEDGSPPDALQVRLGFRFVEWAVGGMPNREHALLLKNRVVDA